MCASSVAAIRLVTGLAVRVIAGLARGAAGAESCVYGGGAVVCVERLFVPIGDVRSERIFGWRQATVACRALN